MCRWRGCALCDITVRTEQGRRFCVQYNLPQNNGNRVTMTVLPRHRGLCRNGVVFYGHCGIGHDVKFNVRLLVDAALLFVEGLPLGKGWSP